MPSQEIVAAIIRMTITSDVADIEASRALGMNVDCITRSEARRRAKLDPNGRWSLLSVSPTLYLKQNGCLFRQTPASGLPCASTTKTVAA